MEAIPAEEEWIGRKSERRIGEWIGGANRRVDIRGYQTWGPSLGTKLRTASGDQAWGTCLLYRFLSQFINFDKFAIEGSASAWMHP